MSTAVFLYPPPGQAFSAANARSSGLGSWWVNGPCPDVQFGHVAVPDIDALLKALTGVKDCFLASSAAAGSLCNGLADVGPTLRIVFDLKNPVRAFENA